MAKTLGKSGMHGRCSRNGASCARQHTAHHALQCAQVHAAAAEVHVLALGLILVGVLIFPQAEIDADVAMLDARLQQPRPVVTLFLAFEVETDVTRTCIPFAALQKTTNTRMGEMDVGESAT